MSATFIARYRVTTPYGVFYTDADPMSFIFVWSTSPHPNDNDELPVPVLRRFPDTSLVERPNAPLNLSVVSLPDGLSKNYSRDDRLDEYQLNQAQKQEIETSCPIVEKTLDITETHP